MSSGIKPIRENGGKDQPPSLKADFSSASSGKPAPQQSLGSNSSRSGAFPAIRVSDFAARYDLSLERALKRGGDLLGALLLAAIFSPIFLLAFIVALIKGQEVLFRHQRVGRDGRMFYCLKFQTMVPNAEAVLQNLLATDPKLRAEWDRDHKLRDDPRVTPLGRFLRGTSLDELPQLWNVLKGDMSLVGPRPITRQELLRYGRNAIIYEMVRPGITGLWQVSGRNFIEYRRRVAMDVVYVKNQSLLLDLWILLKTIVVVVTRHGAF